MNAKNGCGSKMEEEVTEFFKTIGRGRLKRIWQRVKAGDVSGLEDEDRRYAALMEEHKADYFEAFEVADDRVFDPNAEVDAYLHVAVHRIIETQLDENDPIEAVQLYNALMGYGVSHHEATHLLAAVWIPFLFDGLQAGSEFDREGYRRLLKKAKSRTPDKIWDMLHQEAYPEDPAADEGRPDRVFRLRIELEDLSPPVWRRILIPASATFLDLHAAIQGAMGWEDAHLHRFEVIDPNTDQKMLIGRPLEDERWADNVVSGWQYGIADFIDQKRPECRYVYDYGDNWQHRVVLEAVVFAGPETAYPVCVEGERSCPPEDVGGVPGYQDLLQILKDPDHERFGEVREMLGEDFDPERFDPKEVIFSAPEN